MAMQNPGLYTIDVFMLVLAAVSSSNYNGPLYPPSNIQDVPSLQDCNNSKHPPSLLLDTITNTWIRRSDLIPVQFHRRPISAETRSSI